MYIIYVYITGEEVDSARGNEREPPRCPGKQIFFFFLLLANFALNC